MPNRRSAHLTSFFNRRNRRAVSFDYYTLFSAEVSDIFGLLKYVGVVLDLDKIGEVRLVVVEEGEGQRSCRSHLVDGGDHLGGLEGLLEVFDSVVRHSYRPSH